MTNAQTEARAIAERFPAWPTRWGAELRNRVIEEIATALAAKDAELAELRQELGETRLVLEQTERNAERIIKMRDAQLAEANKALDALIENNRKGVTGRDARLAWLAARRALEAQGGENG